MIPTRGHRARRAIPSSFAFAKTSFFPTAPPSSARSGTTMERMRSARSRNWYREGASGPIRSVIDGMLDEWGMTIPDLAETNRDTVNRWLENEQLATALSTVGNVVTAVAFDQLKITGNLDAEVADLALAAIDREALLIAHHERRDPNWNHAATAHA